MEDDGHTLVMRPLLNYTDFNLDAVREMLLHPTSAWGLGDGGAHCGTTCDASTPTFMLTHWARDRAARPAPARVGRAQDDRARPLSLYGLGDRGVLTPGLLGDVNVIDFDRVAAPTARARARSSRRRAPLRTGFVRIRRDRQARHSDLARRQ